MRISRYRITQERMLDLNAGGSRSLWPAPDRLNSDALMSAPPCITIQNDELTFAAMAARSSIPVVHRGGTAGVRGAIRRTGDRRYDAPAANHALALDFTAAGVSE